jgi:branched-chain amino acid transport system substrate-binding protein
MKYRYARARRLPKAAALVVLLAAVVVAALVATTAGGAAKSTIKVAILSDCQGAFGSFYEQDIGGAQAAFAQYAHGKAKDRNKPSAGMTGITVAGHPIKIVGYGCSNDKADTAIKETRRLMERLNADILVGPLSGDESVAVSQYAKQHPSKTFINGAAGAQDTTLKTRAKNYFRFNLDGAQFAAGDGALAYKKLKWRKVAVISDDYSFAWTNSGGFIAEFCALGGKVTKRVYPPLNTTDYSSYAQQLPGPNQVDGYFWAVGGSGLIPSLKAYESAHGKIDGKKFFGNVFWGTPGEFQQLGNRVAGAYLGQGQAGDLKTAASLRYNNVIGKAYSQFPPFGAAKPQAGSVFTYTYFAAAEALVKALQKVNGDISGGQKKLQNALSHTVLTDTAYGKIKLDQNRNAITNAYIQQLYVKSGKLAVKTVYLVPNTTQSFGGIFTPNTPSPGRSFPACTKRTPPPWVNHLIAVKNGVPAKR